MKNITIIITSLFLLLTLSNCDAKDLSKEHSKGHKLAIPEGTRAVKLISEDGSSTTLLVSHDKKLLKLRECQLCPPGQAKKCENDTSGKYCKGLVDATTNFVFTDITIVSEKNPICWTEIEGGKARQRCICIPPETNPLCD